MDRSELDEHLDRVLVGGRERRDYELAERRWDDMNHYADAKGPFIEEVLRDV